MENYRKCIRGQKEKLGSLWRDHQDIECHRFVIDTSYSTSPVSQASIEYNPHAKCTIFLRRESFKVPRFDSGFVRAEF
jgi:hypothetical protein